MALEIKLNPPLIESKIPAFCNNILTIPFDITRAVNSADFNKVVVSIKTVQTNVEKLNWTIDTYYQDSLTHLYRAIVDIDKYNDTVTEDNRFIPQVGQYYKVQLALVNVKDGATGYFSSVGVVKCTADPVVKIENNGDENNQRHRYTYTGVYSQEDGDMTEKVYTYCFNLYNENNELVATSGELVHDNSKDKDFDKSTDTWTVRKNLDANVIYEIEYNITTVNGLEKSSGRHVIIESETKAPNVHADLHATNYFDDGYILVKLEGDQSGTLVNGKFILMRSSSEDNYESWYELTKFDLSNWSSSTDKVICKDYTVQQGLSYIYAIRAYNSVGLFSNRLKNVEGPIIADFEDAFLYDGERQLKIRFNPKVSSFKSTVLETKTDTIGGKYPFVFRNGNVEYKEFSISGLISLLGDENNEFLSNLNAGAGDATVDQGHWLTTDNIRKEREFKMLVLSWLTNGKPKLFRSPSEGNFIIRLMNTSLSPNDTLGRMLHTFTSTAYEIAEFNFDNLKEYGFALEDYIETRTLRIEQLNANNLANTNGAIAVPEAVYVSVVAEPGSTFEYYLKGINDKSIIKISNTGNYIFPEDVLLNTPMISIELLTGSWTSSGSLTYGYYDATVDNFSIVHDISLSDKIVQVIGQGLDYNLIDDFTDIRRSAGAFHYIKIEPRDIIKIYRDNGKYYYNSSKDPVTTFNKNCLYFIYEGLENPVLTDSYFDGQDGGIGYAATKKIANINYNFHITGMSAGSVVDFNGLAPSGTTGRYDALTNLSSIAEFRAGDGLIMNIVYQQKEVTYVVEVSGEYFDIKVVNAKSNWLNEQATYNNLIAINANALQIANQKAIMDSAYETYLYWLDFALENLKEEYDVEYAL